jgi:pSer/pThr/pTyr-binding forkhead associated (FHA) protein
MNIALKITAGPLEGQIFTVERALSIGRQGDIVLEDPKVSGIHANVSQNSSGTWVVSDNESKNGIRVNEIRVKAVALRPGVVFHIGASTFEVVSTDPEQEAGATEVTPVEIPKPKKKQKFWYDILIQFLTKHKDSFKDKARNLTPLEPALVLEFVRGVQMNSKWIVGYGPRRLGPNCIDLPIWEPGAPANCFEIHPTADGILFKTEHRDVVRLNNQAVDSRILHVGDTISIHDTLIEVDFTE